MLPEIFAYGLRNPWRASFDDGPSGTNRLFLADVGQDKVEEINIITAGGNYGWRVKEGTFDFDPTTPYGGGLLIDPIAQYAHPGVVLVPPLPQLGRSIIGGYLYRGSAIPALQGKYVCGDYNAGAINSGTTLGSLIGIEETSPDVWTVPVALTIIGGNPFATHLLALGRDEAGELYLATEVVQGPQNDGVTGLPTGGIYKIVPPVSAAATLTPSKDNSIYSESGTQSNALGNLYAGRTAQGNIRRALIAFDIAPIVPFGSNIDLARLSLNVISSNQTNMMPLYALSQDWGEGASSGAGAGAPATPGDATWTQRFYSATTPVNWTPNSGGTFVAAPSATSSAGAYVWTSVQLATDVQGWLKSPGTNFGWILTADETIPSSTPTAASFGSRESVLSTDRPQLLINYSGAALTRREFWLRQYFVPGHFVDDAADLDGDGISNLLEYAFAFNPLVANPPGAGFQVSTAPAGADTTFTITFRRDPRATDLTYVLQTSSDLLIWTTIAQSVGGVPPTGSGFVSESDVIGESPVKLVVAQETVTAAQGQRFARLRVTH